MARKTLAPHARPDLAGSPRPKKPTQVRARRLLVYDLQYPCSPLCNTQNLPGPQDDNPELKAVNSVSAV